MFKSHILGYPCVIIFNSEVAMFVLNKDQLFKPTFSASKERMLGKQAIFFHQRAYHANLRMLVLRTIMPEAIKDIISEIESIAQSCLKSWEGKLITSFLERKTVSPQTRAKSSISLFDYIVVHLKTCEIQTCFCEDFNPNCFLLQFYSNIA